MNPGNKLVRRSGLLLISLIAVNLCLCRITQGGDGIEEGDRFFQAGRYSESADRYYAAYLVSPAGKRAAEALVKTGRSLDLAVRNLYEAADAACYLNKKRDEANPGCFEAAVADLNRRFGEGAFSYHGDQVQFSYNATHFRRVLSEFPGSPYQGEASLMMLRGGALLQDDPDAVCRKVEDWIQMYPKSSSMPKALLLLGRLHADAFVLFKKGAFIVVGGKYDREQLPMGASKHQFKGLEAFQSILDKYPSSPEAKIAARELEILKNGKDDGIFYGISY